MKKIFLFILFIYAISIYAQPVSSGLVKKDTINLLQTQFKFRVDSTLKSDTLVSHNLRINAAIQQGIDSASALNLRKVAYSDTGSVIASQYLMRHSPTFYDSATFLCTINGNIGKLFIYNYKDTMNYGGAYPVDVNAYVARYDAGLMLTRNADPVTGYIEDTTATASVYEQNADGFNFFVMPENSRHNVSWTSRFSIMRYVPTTEWSTTVGAVSIDTSSNVYLSNKTPITSLYIVNSDSISTSQIGESAIEFTSKIGLLNWAKYYKWRIITNGTQIGDFGIEHTVLGNSYTNPFYIDSSNNSQISLGAHVEMDTINTNVIKEYANKFNLSYNGLEIANPIIDSTNITVLRASTGEALFTEVTATSGDNYGADFEATGIGATSNTGLFLTASGGTTNYGLYIQSPPSGTNNYSIYSNSPAKSYFVGSISQSSLILNATISDVNASNSSLYIGSDHNNHLMYRDNINNVHDLSGLDSVIYSASDTSITFYSGHNGHYWKLNTYKISGSDFSYYWLILLGIIIPFIYHNRKRLFGLLLIVFLLISVSTFAQTKQDSANVQQKQYQFQIEVQKEQQLESELNAQKIKAFDAWKEWQIAGQPFQQAIEQKKK